MQFEFLFFARPAARTFNGLSNTGHTQAQRGHDVLFAMCTYNYMAKSWAFGFGFTFSLWPNRPSPKNMHYDYFMKHALANFGSSKRNAARATGRVLSPAVGLLCIALSGIYISCCQSCCCWPHPVSILCVCVRSAHCYRNWFMARLKVLNSWALTTEQQKFKAYATAWMASPITACVCMRVLALLLDFTGILSAYKSPHSICALSYHSQ